MDMKHVLERHAEVVQIPGRQDLIRCGPMDSSSSQLLYALNASGSSFALDSDSRICSHKNNQHHWRPTLFHSQASAFDALSVADLPQQPQLKDEE